MRKDIVILIMQDQHLLLDGPDVSSLPCHLKKLSVIVMWHLLIIKVDYGFKGHVGIFMPLFD